MSFPAEEFVGPIGVLVTAALLFLLIGWLNRRSERLRREMLANVAEELGGELDVHADGEAWIRFRVDDRDARLAGRQKREWIVAIVDIRGLSPGTMQIHPAGFWTPVARLLRSSDVPTGDAAFDRDFVVKANPGELVEQVFAPERRTEIIDHLRGLGGEADSRVDLSRQRLVLRARLPENPASLAAVARAAEALARGLTRVEGLDILWVHEADAGALCQVCGTEMKENVVQCARCRTIHHRDCWEYMGECSTFACKERRFV